MTQQEIRYAKAVKYSKEYKLMSELKWAMDYIQAVKINKTDTPEERVRFRKLYTLLTGDIYEKCHTCNMNTMAQKLYEYHRDYFFQDLYLKENQPKEEIIYVGEMGDPIIVDKSLDKPKKITRKKTVKSKK
jgi:beta-galactosidase beta subunit